MSSMSELSLVVNELKRCGEALISISESLYDLFSSQDELQESEMIETETSAPEQKSMTLEQVRAVLAEKSRAGYTAKVRELLEKHGAEKLSDIDPSQYPSLILEAEVLGNE